VTRLVRRRALLIGIERYDDSRFAPLPSTQVDTWQLRQVLEDRNVGAFASVKTTADPTADDMRCEISEFLESCESDELALLYVSGHGTRLIQSGGEFYFAAKDTDFDRIAETGVSASFVNERLEECWAPQKVAMIDCCRSGGFAVGLRTFDRDAQAPAKSGDPAPLTSRGVYVLSSSRAGEDSLAGVGTSDGFAPSAFTGEVVEALRTGKVGKDGTGEVSVSDLFHYVNKRMRAANSRQVPVHSAYGVDDRIILASCPLGRARELLPLSRKADVHAATTAGGPSSSPPKRPRSQPTWGALLNYYRECVLSEDADTRLLTVQDDGKSYVCLSGSERFLSGDLDDDECVAVPPEADGLVEKAVEEDAELWTGYPAVVLEGPRSGPSWSRPKFAPLLLRRIEVVQDDGQTRLRPYGPVLPHPRLAGDWLGEEQAAELVETYQPTWHAGQHDRMAVDVRQLLRQEYELPCVQEPRPDTLADRIDVRTPGNGARNAAVLFLAPRDGKATKKLLADLDSIERKSAQIGETALAALSPDSVERSEPPVERAAESVKLVTPLASNEAQSSVLRSAMTRRLTVATGPPGTGKSQLVANLVATAAAAGQSVLVASTNNQAVDEVWRRCNELSPGSVVRTGSSSGATNYAEEEAKALNALLTASAPARNVATSAADLAVARDRLERVRDELTAAARTERALHRAGEAREAHAARLGRQVADLVSLLQSVTDPSALSRKASRVTRARVLGELRRKWLLRRIGISTHEAGERGTADVCAGLADFALAEGSWRAEHERTRSARNDVELGAALAEAEGAVRGASAALLDSCVRTNAKTGRQRIVGLLSARATSGSDWPAVQEVLAAVRGWAVTSLSARRFPPNPALFDLVIVDEASQCAIPHVLPLLFRARRALVIGDTMQLPHITRIGPERERVLRQAASLRSDWLEGRRLAYRRHSAFHAAEAAAGGTLLLDEHFRCHPDIAAVSNRLFYDNRLTVLTDPRTRPALDRHAVIWAPVSGRAARSPSGGSWVNGQEIDKVVASVRHLLEQLPEETGATVGVVTPFKAQEEALQKRLSEYGGRVRTGTVHTFQGGERDIMVFSLVAGEGMHPGAIGWVAKQLNLWNVALTRARSHLIVVGDIDLWRNLGGIGAALADASQSTAGAGDSNLDELHKRLYSTLNGRRGTTVELGTTVNGHPTDAVLHTHTGPTAVLLDPGPDEGADEGRHLRLMLRRRDLLHDEKVGNPALRLPAWKLYDTDAQDL